MELAQSQNGETHTALQDPQAQIGEKGVNRFGVREGRVNRLGVPEREVNRLGIREKELIGWEYERERNK